MAVPNVRRSWRVALTVVAILAIGGIQIATSSAQTRPERPQRPDTAAEGIDFTIPTPPPRPTFTLPTSPPPTMPPETTTSTGPPPTMPPETTTTNGPPPTMPPTTIDFELSPDMENLIEDVIGDLEEFGETFERTIQELQELLDRFGR